MEIIGEMMNKCEWGFTTINHSFAVIISIVPILSTIYAYLVGADNIEYIEDNVWKEYLPWVIPPETQRKDMKALYPCMVKFSTFDAWSIHFLDPFDECKGINQENIQNCVNMIDIVWEYRWSLYIALCFCLPENWLVSNIQFNGIYSKFELLHMAMTVSGAGVYTLAILKCIRSRRLYLKGTPFIENSPVLEKINSKLEETSRITFPFQPRITSL